MGKGVKICMFEDSSLILLQIRIDNGWSLLPTTSKMMGI